MKDPISAWNNLAIHSTGFLFPLFNEIADASEVHHLQVAPIHRQWMVVSYDVIVELYRALGYKNPPITSHFYKDREYAIGYGWFNPEWYLESNSNRTLYQITPCDIDSLCERVLMTAYIYSILSGFTYSLGLQSDDIMRDYRVKVYDSSIMLGASKKLNAMRLAAK